MLHIAIHLKQRKLKPAQKTQKGV